MCPITENKTDRHPCEPIKALLLARFDRRYKMTFTVRAFCPALINTLKFHAVQEYFDKFNLGLVGTYKVLDWPRLSYTV